MTDYVELHARSAFSFLEGASTPEELVARCAALDQPALAVLDRDSLSGAVRLHMAAKKAGIRAHIGAEVSCVDGRRYPLLAETQEGYRNLCRLLTRMKLRAPKGEGACTWDDLAEFAPGLICLTGGEHAPLDFRPGSLDRLLSLFGPRNVYCELQRHYNRNQEAYNQAVIETARSARLPLLATNGPAYATADARPAQDVLTAIRHHTTLEHAGRLLDRNAERHMKHAREMAALFADCPDSISTTRELSSRLAFTLDNLGYQFPRYPVGPGETMDSFLRRRVAEGAVWRYGSAPPSLRERAARQLERELRLIEKLHLAGYFLIVWDIVRFCRSQGILAQGRGSAANSAVCYSLGITAVDPVAMELLFERFLSEERGEWPDIDLDLPSGEERERVIQYVYSRYGPRGAAMTANVITYRGRLAVREIAKVLGFEEEQIARLARLVPLWGWRDDDEDAPNPTIQQAGLRAEDPRTAAFRTVYERIRGLPRHLGQHSGGMVICEGELDSIVPLEPATMPGRVVLQWDKEDCAGMGIIKVDLLGLGMMAVLAESIDLIRRSYGEEVDLAHLPADDPLVYEALRRADTVGMFQVESRAQMSCLPRLQPRKFYDLVVQVAIIRPGPIVGKMLHPYLRRRQGREPVVCLHPSLEPVLRRTLGVPLFQEQLLRMAMIVANFTGGEAEELRRAMGFKRSAERMREIETRLRSGMEANGIRGQTQDAIVQSITAFALYGFPESHAASFALLAYASAYLKCHYLAAFTAAMLNNQPMGFYAPATLVKDAQRHGLRFLPVDVNRSLFLCTIEEENGARLVRLGLNYVRGLSKTSAEAIVNARGRHGPFQSVLDLARRANGLRRDELRRLAEAGALNSLADGLHRREALWRAEAVLRPAGPLLEALEETEESAARGPLPPMNPLERLEADYRSTALTIGRHPMAFERDRLRALDVTPAAALHRKPNGATVRIAGCVICRQRPETAKGLCFLSIEDETGIANAVLMPDKFAQYRLPLMENFYLFLEGELQNVDGVRSVKVESLAPLARAGHEYQHLSALAVPGHFER
jgi:error-prone DNA polymerase